jgi:uncharacterized linocin/CFP29 family protein
MADLLRRSLAPVSEKAWEEIDSRAAEVLSSQLTARRIVDFSGPHGWQFAAVNLGRLEIPKGASDGDVPWGRRSVLPLVETRVPFTLGQMEVDGIARGAKDAELEPLEDAARRIARFEESAVYNGFEPGGIEGIIARSEHEPVPLSNDTRSFPEAVSRAVQALTLAGIPGPFALVLGTEAWAGLMQSGSGGYPPQRIIRDLTDGNIRMSPAIEGGLVISTAEANFELSVGQDFSIGYVGHDRNSVELYLAESFTFRVLEPRAAVRLVPA